MSCTIGLFSGENISSIDVNRDKTTMELYVESTVRSVEWKWFDQCKTTTVMINICMIHFSSLFKGKTLDRTIAFFHHLLLCSPFHHTNKDNDQWKIFKKKEKKRKENEREKETRNKKRNVREKEEFRLVFQDWVQSVEDDEDSNMCKLMKEK